jgi:hypothetical protein
MADSGLALLDDTPERTEITLDLFISQRLP